MRLRARVASHVRVAILKLAYPGLDIDRASHVGPDCDIQVGRGGTLTLRGVTLKRGVTVLVGEGAVVQMNCPYVGPNSVIVSRKSITIRGGTMIAEMAVIRDSNHERDELGRIESLEHQGDPILIGNDAWIAAGATVLAGVLIGDRATVAAGAVVTKSVPSEATVAGVPAQLLRSPGAK